MRTSRAMPTQSTPGAVPHEASWLPACRRLDLCGRFVPTAATALALLAAGCATTQHTPALSAEQRRLNLESFDQVWSTINDQYWDRTFGGLDWPAVRDELRPKLEQADSMPAARAVLCDMVGRLRVSHFLILPGDAYRRADDTPAPDAPYGDTGINARVVDGAALVTAVASDSSADRAGVRPGWELLRIDDQDVPAALARLAQELGDNPKKPLVLNASLLDGLLGPVESTVALSLRNGGDEVVTLQLPRTQERGHTSPFGNAGPIRVWIDVRRLDGNVGYIAFNGFFDPPYLMKTFNDALQSFLDADGLILDLRGNGGGLGAMALGMAGWLIREPGRCIGTLSTRQTELKMIIMPRPQTYAGPLAVLVDELTGSAAEFLSAGLQQLGRARVFGQRTKGEALPGQLATLPNGDVFLYATANFVMADGARLEGRGVVPDEEVSPARAALLAGRDPVLEAALTWIREQK